MPMSGGGIPMLGQFSASSLQSGTTVANILVPPFPGPANNPPYMFNAATMGAPLVPAISSTRANWLAAPNFGLIHISSIQVTASSTSHSIQVMRPLNWTYFPAGLAKNTTLIPDTSGASGTGIFDDPGVYSTNYKYATPGAIAPSQVADAAISSTNKAVCYQLADGTWQYDTIASGTFGSSLTLTTGTPNRNSGTIPAGGVMFYFGAVIGTLKDPATGNASLALTTVVSVNDVFQDMLVGEFCALHQGDPMLVYDPNATAADTVIVSGYYGGY